MTVSLRVALATLVAALWCCGGGRALVDAADDQVIVTDASGNSSAAIPTSMLVLVSLSCSLSMFGAGFIIASYLLFPKIRTKAREILVHISLMDFLTAAFNLFGIVLTKTAYGHRSFSWLCQLQAALSMYGTETSVLWTIGMAVYIYARVLYEDSRPLRCITWGLYLFCYGLPAILTVWFSLSNKLGYDRLGGSGWCSLIVQDQRGYLPFNLVFGNDVWIYLTIILVPVILVGLHFHLRRELRITSSHLSSSVISIELKLLLVPVVFILLRMWSLLLTIIEVEARYNLPPLVVSIFLHISGVGDSGQGFANFILFCLFTPRVMKHVCRCCLSPERTTLLINRSTSSEAKHRLSPVSDSNDGHDEERSERSPLMQTGLPKKSLIDMDS